MSRSKLDDILEALYEQGIKDSGYSDSPSMNEYEAKAAIIELLKEAVPEDYTIETPLTSILVAEQAGFNACRFQILEAIDKL